MSKKGCISFLNYSNDFPIRVIMQQNGENICSAYKMEHAKDKGETMRTA